MPSTASPEPLGIAQGSTHLGAISRRELFTLTFDRPSARAEHWIHVRRRAMACWFEVVLSGEDARHVAAAREALDEISRIEAALTVFRDTSELARVNRRAGSEPVAVQADLFELLGLCRELHAWTEGAFDITTTPLSRCWGFLKREPRVPSRAALNASRACVGMAGLELSDQRRSVRFLRRGMELNLGSIGKGYALDRVAALLRPAGVGHALLSAGGSSILALGDCDGGWLIDLRSRQVKAERLGQLRLRDGALGTSGAGEQFVENGGRRYGHVLDPRTGWPAAGVVSASVVARDAAVADALSTAFLVGGVPLARRYCESRPHVLALLTPDDGSERPCAFGSYPGAVWEEA